MAREMKDSGIEGVGIIPNDWNISRLKYVCQINTEFVDPRNGEYDELPHIGPGNIEKFTGRLTDYKLVKDEGLISGKYHFYSNDIVYGKINPQLGKVVFPEFEGLCSADAYAIHTIKGKMTTKYLLYYMLTRPFIDATILESLRMGMPKINQEDLMKLPIPVPNLEEQQRIVSVLDNECSRIDAVIDQTRASIEEYKKLKQAVITQAVTKGIRPGRPMKDSGIEWIGEIPEEWAFTKTLNCLSMPITDGPHTTPELYDDGIAFISAEAVSCGKGKIDFSHMRGYISQEFYEECCKKYVPRIDDIYMIKSGATTGRVSIVDTLEPLFTIWSPLAVFRCNTDKMIPKFLFYVLQSDGFQKQVEFGWTYGTQQNIGMRTLEQLKVCVPPLSEQNNIIEWLDDRIITIDRTINEKEKMMSELESYKKSVIYEYVTGKKEVPQS